MWVVSQVLNLEIIKDVYDKLERIFFTVKSGWRRSSGGVNLLKVLLFRCSSVLL